MEMTTSSSITVNPLRACLNLHLNLERELVMMTILSPRRVIARNEFGAHAPNSWVGLAKDMTTSGLRERSHALLGSPSRNVAG
jgi:hypothetical protein